MVIRTDAVEHGGRGRPGRGLGPFTSAHLTIIVVTLVVVVGFPFAAYAVTGNNIFITDAGSGQHAGVDAKHNLDTAIHDPSTGKGAKVDASGNLQTKLNGGSVAIAGSVTAPQAAPSTMFAVVGAAFTGANNCNFFTPKAGFAAVITSIDEYTTNATTLNPINASFQIAAVNNCSAGTEITEDGYTSDVPHTVSLGAGLGIAAGHHLALYYLGPEGAAVSATVYGYYVPAAQCSTGCL